MKTIELSGFNLTFQEVHAIAKDKLGDIQVVIAPSAKKLMQQARSFVMEIAREGKPVYSINTGFGALSNIKISDNQLTELQYNIIRSHCTGVGEPFDRQTARAIMVLRANALCSGNSGVAPEVVQLLLDFINCDVTPFIPRKGSVGASGDLAPLSHIALNLIGEGEVFFQGKLVPAHQALEAIGKEPACLGPKDGLALINGTAVMAAIGGDCLAQAYKLAKIADIAACLTNEAVRGTSSAYDPDITRLKPHPGQLDCTANLNTLLGDSEIRNSHRDCGKVQDPYSLRCVPQVHGACRQTLKHAEVVLKIELNSVTDNPLVFPEQKKIVSGGNFHGEALALCLDYLAMGLSELANISERRIEKMMNPLFSELPHFLAKEPGVNSGLMIAQVTAAALASENKILSHPASVDSIPTSTDKEDHVSMGVTAGTKLLEVIKNLEHVLAIELLSNTQALEFLRPLKSTAPLEAVYDVIRKKVAPIDSDRIFYKDIENIKNMIADGDLLSAVEKHTGPLR